MSGQKRHTNQINNCCGEKRHQSESGSGCSVFDNIRPQCRELVCAAKAPKIEKPKCPTSVIETNEITVCDQFVLPTAIDVPHQIYPRIKCCDSNKQPRAPIVAAVTDGPTFSALGLDFFLRAGAIDTGCRAEIAIVTIPGSFSTVPLINYASDLAFTVIVGPVVFTVNGIQYSQDVGGFVLVKSGSTFSIANVGTQGTFELVALGPGTLGFFNEVAIYQTAVGSLASLDPCVVEEIGKKYCIVPAPGTSLCIDGQPSLQLPGTVRFLPTPGAADCCNGSWGLSCCQYLIITSNFAAPLPGTRPSVTIKPKARQASIVLDTAVGTIDVTATVIRDPECGLPDVLATPTINGLALATLTTGQTYYVLFDSVTNNLTITPTFNFLLSQ